MSECGEWRRKEGERTQRAVGEAHALLEEAVELAHLANGGLRPFLLHNDGLDFSSQDFNPLGNRGQMIQRVSYTLS